MLEHEQKELIRDVIEGMTYHEKYKLYKELAKNLIEPDVLKALLETKKKRVKTPITTVIRNEDLENG